MSRSCRIRQRQERIVLARGQGRSGGIAEDDGELLSEKNVKTGQTEIVRCDF